MQFQECGPGLDDKEEIINAMQPTLTCNLAVFLIALLCFVPVHNSVADEKAEASGQNSHIVEIAFATNRNIIITDDITEIYGDESGPISFGTCTVEFTPINFLKSAARHIPLRFPTEIENIIDLQPMEEGRFWPRLQQRVDELGQKVVFYIHGYKMDFVKSCRRAALMQRDLGPDVALLLFAWPSQDNFALYTQDETALRKSVGDIQATLNHMLETFDYGRADVVGHSLGTRGVSTAIAGLTPGDQPLFDELVLIAPDMDRLEFAGALPKLSRAASGITMYVSENDGPLRVSQEVHGEPRIGEAGEFLTLFEGVETIDITAVPRRDSYRHNYHYFNERVIDDLSLLLTRGVRAGKRPGLREQAKDDKPYWEMLE